MCLYPKLIRNPKYKPNKKNEGNVPIPKDWRVMAVPIGCGNCEQCRKQKAREWKTRLTEHVKEETNGHMVTLTFTTKSLKELRTETTSKTIYEQDNEIATIAIRRFLERWRKENKKSVQHWLITELGHGKFEHMHIHGIIWTDEPKEKIQKHWQYGTIWAGYQNKRTYVNERTVGYIIKYVTKIDQQHKHYKPKILCSPGLGKKYTETAQAETAKKKEVYTTKTGHKIAIPTYYKNKIYTEEERENLWLKKLDEEIRYVNGHKIDISKGNEEYNNAVAYARQISNQQGYGNDNVNWEEKEYEEQRRTLIINGRLATL